MILSVSRRTDIPAFYSEWFLNRIKEGYVYVRNPFNANQISKVDISSNKVDCIVFWSKNPKPIIKKLPELDEMNYKYYFYFTITPYHEDLETNLPNKKDIVNTFIELANSIGKEKVILRYDPIIVTERYNFDFHFKAFRALCERLHNHTEKVMISFLDDYKKISGNMKPFNVKELDESDMKFISRELNEISKEYGLIIETCAEKIDLEEVGIRHGKCIDGELIERIIGYPIINKDKLDGNRENCGCMKCIDIGQYDSCIHNCLYCYANVNEERVMSNYKQHNSKGPILFGNFDERHVKERKDVKSLRAKSEGFIQKSLFD